MDKNMFKDKNTLVRHLTSSKGQAERLWDAIMSEYTVFATSILSG